MANHRSELGLPIGDPLTDWKAPPPPGPEPMEGRFCRIEIAEPNRHACDLHAAFSEDLESLIWTYLPYGPFNSTGSFREWMNSDCRGADPMFHSILDRDSGRALGVASFLNIKPATGVIEVGHINLSPRLQRRPAATEAMYLMMRRVFSELGYRRYEWKCDALNSRSRRAAQRLGFRFEGVFRNATIYKERNRDTAWFSIIDSEWPAIERAFERWLDPGNFDDEQGQRRSLGGLIEFARAGS